MTFLLADQIVAVRKALHGAAQDGVGQRRHSQWEGEEMSEPKWTPGPWRAEHQPNGPWAIVFPNDSGFPIPLTKANARLIAAAPDLYAALEKALDLYRGALAGARMLRGETHIRISEEDDGPEIKELAAVLRSARGEAP